MSWPYLVLLPFLLFAAACLPLGRLQRAAIRCLAWLTRLAVLGWLSLLGIYIVIPEWLPTEAVLSFDDWLGLSSTNPADPWRPILGLLCAGAATVLAAPLLALLDFTRTLGRFEQRCRTLTQLLNETLQLAENTQSLANGATPPPLPVSSAAPPKSTVKRLRPLSEFLE